MAKNKYRRWTEADDAILRESYRKVPVEQLAKRLNRGVAAVYNRASVLGVANRYPKDVRAARDEQIRKLVPMGFSDAEIAEQIGMARRAVCEYRSRMGIAASGLTDRYRKRVAEATLRQCEAAGVKNLGELRSKVLRKFSEDMGWPGVSIRAAQIAELLYNKGPMTRRQITEALGLKWRSSRHALKNRWVPGGSYLGELQRAGIVIRLPAAICRGGRGNNQSLYMIALEVEPCRKA